MENIFVTGVNGELSKSIAERLKKEKNFCVTQISVKGNQWKELSFNNIRCIVHVAGITPQNAKSEDDYEIVNHRLTCDLAEKAKIAGVNQFVYISSMAVYGVEQQMNAKNAAITKDTICKPTSEYGKSKLNAEKYLNSIEDEKFSASIIRVPSIYGKGKTEYLDQYRYLAGKLPVIPYAFVNLYKSAIYIDNLCELIYLTVKSNYRGIICPDDGEYAAADYCSAICNKKKSRIAGKLLELFLKNNSRIIDYYGAVCYSNELTNIFDGKYRKVSFYDAIRRSYEE